MKHDVSVTHIRCGNIYYGLYVVQYTVRYTYLVPVACGHQGVGARDARTRMAVSAVTLVSREPHTHETRDEHEVICFVYSASVAVAVEESSMLAEIPSIQSAALPAHIHASAHGIQGS